MLQPSRRDRIALEPLLPYINREITADPEQRDPARRAARRQAVAQASSYFKKLRAEEEEKKEQELRASLAGKAITLARPRHTDCSGSRIDTAPRNLSRGAAKRTDRHVPGLKASIRPKYSGHTEEKHGVFTHKSPLSPNMSE